MAAPRSRYLKKINALIADIERDPFRGLGKPEALKFALTGWWSRRITQEHRLVYRVSGKPGAQILEIARAVITIEFASDAIAKLLRAGQARQAKAFPLRRCGENTLGEEPMATLDEHLEDLVIANRILAHEGVVDGFGHVSLRHPQRPDRFFMSRSRSPELVTRDDIMEFDLDCNPIDQRGRVMYGERPIHGAHLPGAARCRLGGAQSRPRGHSVSR